MKRLIALIAFQVVAILGWAAQNEYVRTTAPTFRIPLAPRDPYDLLRGRYFVMNPRDASLKTGTGDGRLTTETVKQFLGSETSFTGPALVGFCPQEEAFRICALSRLGAPSDAAAQYWSRARLDVDWEREAWQGGKAVPEPGYRVRIDLALDRFFLPNRVILPGHESETGWEVEVSHRPGLSPLPKRLLFRGAPVVP